MKHLVKVAMALLPCFPFFAAAQDQTDALRYSQTGIGGTARFLSMGGAFCAVGGDPSALTFNPGGIGVFTYSQFSFSPGLNFRSVNSTFNYEPNSNLQVVATVQNAAWVGAWKNRHDDALWKYLNFGIAYNRTNDFNANITIEGSNASSSLLDVFSANANGTTPDNLDPFSLHQAFWTGLIDTVRGSHGTSYYNIIDPYLDGKNYILQKKTISTSGSMGETDISFGANYMDKLYLGFSLGIPDIKYSENADYREIPQYTDTLNGLAEYRYNTTLSTRGSGVNFKAGAIYKAADWVRIGAAIHSPTLFSLSDNYSSFISATYNGTAYAPNGGTFPGTTDGNPVQGSFSYTLITPMHVMGGVAFIIHNQGILSADYEYVNYSASQLHSSPDQFSEVNQAIAKAYGGASNVRFGAEWVLLPFSFRAGYAYYGDPYAANAGNQSIRNSFSAGMGIKINHWFIDMAYMLTKYSEKYYIYDPALVSPALNQTDISAIAFTAGVNF